MNHSQPQDAVGRLLDQPPYGLSAEEKTAVLLPAVREELSHHFENCPPFRRWCEKRGFRPSDEISDLSAVPFLPVGVFKRILLSSTPENRIVRILSSSATSSQTPSRVVLDQITRNRQIRALMAILVHRLGGARRPFVVLDVQPTSESPQNREISARTAGMRGYLMAAAKIEYVMCGDDGRLTLDVDKLIAAIDSIKAAGEPFCLLGYTYLLYSHVVAPLHEKGVCLKLPPNAVVLHFGGWKKLRDRAVAKSTLNAQAAEVFGISPHAICDVYGFTEQLGVVYPDCADGVKRTPTYSEIFVRDPATLELLPDGQAGLLEFVCPLPHSYPGVAVLLDDIGRIVTRAPGPSGETGVGFEVLGRAAHAEPRGCGDTLPAEAYD